MKYFPLLILFASFLNAVSISGIISDSKTKDPLENVNITIEDLPQMGTSSDEYGKFQINNISNGNHKLTFSRIGYKSYTKSFVSNEGNLKSLSILLQKDPIKWNAINVMGMIPSKHSPEITEIIKMDNIANTEQETLSSLLNNLHGIEIQSAHDHGRNVNVSIRGSSDFKPGGYNNRVLLLLDGFPVSIPNSGSSDWNAIPFETVKHIEVVRGPASSIYGHNSMGGVINIVTKTGSNTTNWFPELRFGSYGSRALSLAYSGNINKTNLISSLGYGSSEGHRFNSGYEQLRLSLKLNKSLKNNQQVQFSFINSNSFNGQPGFVYPDNPDLISYRESNRSSNYFQFFYKKLNGNYLLTTSLATNIFNTDYNDREDAPEEKVLGQTHYRDKSYILRTQLQRFFYKEGSITLGSEIAMDFSKSNVLRNIYKEPEQFTAAGFIQFMEPISENFKYDLGLRYDIRQVSGGKGYSTKSFKALSPKFSLIYEPFQNTITYFSLNKGFRAPSISELFLEYESSYGLLLLGNPNLNAESLTNFEVGIKTTKEEGFSLFGNLFMNHYRNMIDFVYTIPVRSINREIVHSLGFELGSNIAFSTIGTNINFVYSYLDMENIDSNIPLLYRPKHTARVTISQKTPVVDIQLSSKFTSTQFYEDFLSDDHPIVDDKVIFPLEELPKTIITSASISKSINDYDLTLKIKNLFDTKYVMIQHYPMPERNFQISITKRVE